MDSATAIESIKVNGDMVTIPSSLLFINSVSIVKALNRINDTQLPLPVSYRIQRLTKAMQEEYKEIDKIRLELFKLHGKETEPGTYTLEGDEEAQAKFTKDFDDMVGDRKPIRSRLLPCRLMTRQVMDRMQCSAQRTSVSYGYESRSIVE